VGETWAAGINLMYARSKTDFSFEGQQASRTRDHSYGGRLGLLHSATNDLNLGLVADVAVTPSTTTMFDIFGAGTGDIRLEDDTHQFLLRSGAAYTYAKGSTLYLDYQFGRFANDTGVLIVNRFFAGAEQRMLEWLYLRGGFAADTRANFAVTAGIGLYPTDWISIDFGYQENYLPELDPNFGRARVFSFSASASF
jgi:hypothetical protein